ncbi:hypothetical protein G7Y79_00073g098230 [Physcia stellaris]|nr:hypothetical protein G7Y79_00073g098230 [Physcia stellaris]
MAETDPFNAPFGEPGFDVNGDQRGRIIGANVSIIVITTVFVCLRLLSRKLSRAGFWELLIHKKRLWLKGLFIFELFFHTATTLSKFSILAFYHRIFAVPRFRRTLVWVAIVCVVYMVGIDLTILFQCRPLHFVWDKADPTAQGHCFDEDKFFKGSGSVNVFLNFLIFALPIPLLFRLRTTFRQQMVLTAIFMLAGFVVLVSVIWIVVLSSLSRSDVTWNFINAGIWSALEPNMAVVCACIPSLRPLATIVTQGVFQHPLLKSTLKTTTSGSSSKRIWAASRSKLSEGTFSHLEEADDMRPFGHGVSVYGGSNQPDGENVELPRHGINIKTEIEVISYTHPDYHVYRQDPIIDICI